MKNILSVFLCVVMLVCAPVSGIAEPPQPTPTPTPTPTPAPTPTPTPTLPAAPASQGSGYTTAPGGTVSVKGYYRKDGTYVAPHTRKKPSKSRR